MKLGALRFTSLPSAELPSHTCALRTLRASGPGCGAGESRTELGARQICLSQLEAKNSVMRILASVADGRIYFLSYASVHLAIWICFHHNKKYRRLVYE